jgi:peroxiredoxin
MLTAAMFSGKASAEDVPAGVTTLKIGAPAPDFDLPGVDDRHWKLADFAEAKLLLVVFTCNHCPTAQAYEERLTQMHRDYSKKGVAMVAISPNDPEAVNLSELGYTDLGDTFEEMKLRAKERDFPFPYLYDGETQKTSRAYGVMATPHVFLFDAARTLRYVGRIDDGEVDPPKSHEARNAIDALLAGREVPVAVTKVFGCSTKWAGKKDAGLELVKRWNAEDVTLEDIDLAGVKALAANETEKFRLVNVWATWCAPCVDELPLLVDINRMYRRRAFEMVTLSMDDVEVRAKALDTLTSNHVSATNYLFTGDDKDALVEALDAEWAGPAPYTVLIAPGGKIVYRHQGPIDSLELKRAIVEQVGRTYAADRKPATAR